MSPVRLPLFEETYSVAELCDEVREILGQAFASVWVAGEVQRARSSRRGHFYFELVEKGPGDEIVGKLDATIWRLDFRRVQRLLSESGQEIAEGQQIRCRGTLDFYGPGGRLQLVVREVDPVFTIGLLAQRRREVLEALAAAGLLEANKALPLPELPLVLALITSRESAAYHDFLSTLRESGYRFRVLLIDAAVQGRDAERELVSALGLLAPGAADCAVLIRGGGARSDLAIFDGARLAEAVARAPVPVLTGLGHEIDQSIADLVAHTALKTPTKVAEFLVGRVAAAERQLGELARALRREALEPLRRARESLGAAERGVELARFRMRREGERLDDVEARLGRAGTARLRAADRRAAELTRRLRAAVRPAFARGRRRPGELGRRLVAAGQGRVREARIGLEGRARLCAELAPERLLARGLSVTRDGRGRLLRDPAGVAPGERITSRLAGGLLASRVEER